MIPNGKAFHLPKNGKAADQIKISVPLNDCPLVQCSECGCSEFHQGLRIRKVSGLINTSGEDRYVHVPIMACMNCGQVLPEKP